MVISKVSKGKIADYLSGHYSFFKNTVDIIRKTNEILPKALDDYDLNAKKEIQESIKKMGNKEKRAFEHYISANKNLMSNKQKKVIVKNKYIASIIKKTFQTGMYANRIKMFVREMSLVYLVLEFEQFLNRSLQNIYDKYPMIMKSSQKEITYENLFAYNNIDELKSRIGEKEADSLVREDIVEIASYFKDKMNLSLETRSDWKKFKECFYRRNIAVHNNCYPNEKYRIKTGYKGKQVRLDVSDKYLYRSLNLFEIYSEIIKNHFISKYC